MTKKIIFIFLLAIVNSYAQKEVDVTKIDKNMTVSKVKTDGTKWFSPKEAPFRLQGFKWIQEDTIYRRLPINPKNIIIPSKVNILANHTSGGQIHFKSNSKNIIIRVKLKSSRPMYHMTQVAKQGFDLYVGGPHNKLFNSSTKFKYTAKEYTSKLYYNSKRDMKEYTINFPLYNGVESILIGLDENAKIEAPSPLENKKSIIIYGTSITQGGCASRPGMSYPNILSRKLNTEVVNLGFSGSGNGEPEIAELINKIDDKSLVIVDIECNTYESLRKVLKPFIETFRKEDKKTPLLIISRTILARDQHSKYLKQRNALKEFQKNLVGQFKDQGDKNIYFLDGSTLLKPEWAHEATVDGTHMTDLGFLMMAEAIEPHITKILND